jgi:hypothetical protein
MYTILASSLITRANTYINSVGNRVGNLLWYDYITASIKLLRAGRTLPWSRREEILIAYSDVFVYSLPVDFSSLERINNPRVVGPTLVYSTEKEFKRQSFVDVAVGWDKGEKFLLLRRDGSRDTQLEEFGDEVIFYTLIGDINNPVSDDSNYVSGNAALRFDLYQSSSNNFTIARTLADSIDLSEDFALSKLFCDIYMPTVITGGFKLRISTDAGNYYETPLITVQTHGLALQAGWNKLSALCDEMVETGAVDLTNITAVSIICPATGGVIDDGFAVNGFYARVGVSYNLGYNSNQTIITSSTNSILKSVVDDGANLIKWDEDFDDILLFAILDKAGFFSFRDNDVVQKVSQDREQILADFSLRYPSQEMRHKVIYYPKRNRF